MRNKTDWIDFIRGSVRPIITYAFAGTVLVIGTYLAIKFATPELAQQYAGEILKMTLMILAMWFVTRPKRG